MIAEKALAYIGTPFVHQARVPGHGLDCVGVFVCAARECGIPIEDFTTYGRDSDPVTLLSRFKKDFNQIQFEDRVKDDVLLFWILNRELPQHIGILIDPDNFVHAYGNEFRGKVRVESVSPRWEKKIHSIWRLK